MLGIGYIKIVNRQKETKFLNDVRANGIDDFEIHPETGADEKFIIKFIEPLEDNIEAIGLDISFEKNRKSAANLARDTGLPIMTQHIQLVQDKSIKLGFLLLHPYYATEMPLDTVLQRRAAVKGWVYTPFIGQKVFEKLAIEHQDEFYVSVYDGNEIDPGTLIYDNQGDQQSEAVSKYILTSNVELFGRTWTLIWRSSPEYEVLHTSNGPMLVLFIGILLTAILVSIVRIWLSLLNVCVHGMFFLNSRR